MIKAGRASEGLSGHTLPNFLIGGAAQSGTSALALSIAQHPQVFMPARTVPEPHYFLKTAEYGKGLAAYTEAWFADVQGEVAVGEKSSSYLFGGETVAQRIMNDLGSVRLIFTLRNPIERSWAHYRFSALNGIEPLCFEEALRQEADRVAELTGPWAEIQPFNYTGRGLYAKQLEPFLEIFGSENILILKSEDIRREGSDTYAKIFDFLGVEVDFQPVRVPSYNSPTVRDPADQARCRRVFENRFGEVLKAVRTDSDLAPYASTDEERHALEVLVHNLCYDPKPMSGQARQLLGAAFLSDLATLKRYVPFDIEDWYLDAEKASKQNTEGVADSRRRI